MRSGDLVAYFIDQAGQVVKIDGGKLVGHRLLRHCGAQIVACCLQILVVVAVFNSGPHGAFAHACVQGSLQLSLGESLELASQAAKRAQVLQVVGHEERIGEALGRQAALVLVLARQLGGHLAAFGRFDVGQRQLGVEVTPQQGALGIGVTKVGGLEAH